MNLPMKENRMEKKKRIVQILRIIMPLVGLTCAVVLSPLDGIWAWITPVPDTVQEQVDDAIGHGLDGIIVYVDEADQPPLFYTCLLYTSPSPRDGLLSRMPSSA